MTAIARGLYGQVEVVHALMLRETRTRFGRYQLGYMWALVEPTLMILTFFTMFRLSHRTAPFDMDLFGFLCTGIVPYYLFRNSTTQVAESINGNKALLFYPRVHPLDLVFARGLLEAVTYAAVFMVLMAINGLFRQQLQIDSALYVVAGFTLASLLGMAVGLVFCGVGQLSRFVERARGPVLRPLFWISGVFFAADALPEGFRNALLHNPVLHCVEYVRRGWFPSYEGRHADAGYVLAWILAFAVAGLLLERVVRRRIEVK